MAKKIEPKLNLLLEALKEPARLAVLAVVAWLLTVIVPQLDDKWIPIITVILRFIDAKLHEIGKSENNELLSGGLTRF